MIEFQYAARYLHTNGAHNIICQARIQKIFPGGGGANPCGMPGEGQDYKKKKNKKFFSYFFFLKLR